MTNFPKSTIFAVFAIIVNYNQVAADPQVDQGSLCRSHQYFDTEKNQCMDLPGGGTIISEDKVHNCADGVPRPHESEGRYYYVCKCDKTILAECPLGLRYDDGEKGCIQDVGWKTVRLVQDEYSFIQLPACLEPGLFPIPDYCSLYYSCNVTSSYLLQSISVCPPSTAFSPSLKICAFTESCSGDLVHLLANSVSRTQVLNTGQADRTGSFLIEAIRTLRRKLHRPENVEPESSEEPTSPRPEDESHEEVPDAPSSETSGGSSHSSEETSSETPSASSPSFEELNQNQESQNAQKSVTITVESSGVKAVLPAPQPVTEPSSNGGESGTKETNQGSVNIAINTSESTTTPATVEETPADNQSGIEEIVERGEQQRENQQSVNIVIGSQETTTPAPENYPSLIETQDQDEKKEEENKQSVNIVINTSQSTTTPAPIVEVPVGNENEEIEKQVQQRENQQSVNIVIGSSETTTPAPEPYPSLIETQEQQQEKKEGENKQSVNIVIDTSQSTTTPAPIIEVPVVEVSGGNQGGVQEVVEQGEQQRENQQSVNIVIGSPETTTPAPEPSPSLIETQEQQQEEKKEGENKQSVNIVIDTSQSTTTPAPIIEVPVVEVPGGSQGEILEVVEQGEQQRENQPSVNIVINTSESTTTPGSIIVEESGVGGETQEIVNQEEEKKGEKQQSVEIVINTPQATTTPAPEVEGPVGNEGGTQQEVVRQEGQEEKQQSVNIVIGTSASTTPAPEPELYPSILEQGVTDQEHRQHEDERKQSITIEINSGSTTTPGTLLEEEDELLGHAAMTQNVRKKEVHEGENQQSVKITIGSTETTSPASQDYQPYEFEGGEHRQTHYLQSQSQHRLQQSHSHGLSSSWQSGYSSQFDQPLPTGQQWSSGGQHVTSYKKYVKQPGVSWSIMSPLYSTEPSTGSSGSFSSSYQHTKKVLRRITHPDGTVSTYYENGSNENPEESVANAHAESGYQESKTHHAERQQSVRILIGPQQTTTKPAPSKEQSGGSSSGLFGNFHKVLRKVVNPVGKVSTYYENGSSKNGEEAESTGDVTSEGENDQEESQASGGIFGNILHYPKKVLRKVVNPDGSLSTFWSRSVQKMSGGSAERESEGSNSYSHHGLNINGGVSLGDFRVGGGFSLKKSSNAGTTLGSAGGSSYQAHHGQNIHMTTHSAGSTKNVSYVLSSGSSAPAHAKISLNGGSFPATLDVSENGNAHGSQHAGSSSAYGSASSQAHSFGGHFSKSHHVQTSHSSHTGYQGTKIVRRKWFRFKGHCSGVGIFRVPNSCSGYYECTLNDQNLYTISSVKFCPACLRFNPQLGRCDFPLNVPECSDGKSESRNCTGEGSFPHSELSSVYYVCSKTPDEITLETRTCPIGQAFDKTVGKCNDNPKDKSQPQECEDLTDLPDNFDCSRYYSCEQLQEDGDLEKVAKTCPSGFYFNSDSDTCSRPDEISGFPAETLIDIRHST
ncbi:uncharacterized protein LOC105702166 isoform X2 [Orussus abietinus]|uniref:uncharacterized protein LOC105702166 isoform X2 n=1 Tax=Orussus abietinus TaxID=222816 RepID=UPI000625592A|nr:uncharacterized protein LOC105702166 isoform X2 [Orussus abietinus]